MQRLRHSMPGSSRSSSPDRDELGNKRRSGWAALALGIVLALLIGVAPSFVSHTSTSPDSAFAADPEEIVTINATETVKMEDFLALVSKSLDTPLVWDPTERNIKGKAIKGGIRLTSKRKHLFGIVRALLTFYELAMIPVGPGEYQVQLIIDTKQQGRILRLKPEYVNVTDENVGSLANEDGRFITTTIKVENMSELQNARNAFSRISSQNLGQVTEVPQAKAFVVTDFAPNVVAIYRLLKEMDVQPEGKEIRAEYRALQHATADEIEPILQDLFTGNTRPGASNTRPNRPRSPNNRGSTFVDEDPEPQIIGDARTNQIIIWATNDDIQSILEVIDRLDQETFLPQDKVHVIKLKNLEAVETADVLTQLIEAASIFGTDQAVSGRSGNQGRANATGRVGDVNDPRLQPKPAVVADEKSNSLIVAGTNKQFEEIKRVVSQIDVQKDQVLIEAALVELTLDDAYTLAFELGAADDNGLVNNDAASAFGFTSYGQTTFADKNGDTFFTDRIPPFVDDGTIAAPRGLVGGIFAFGQVPLIMNLLNRVQRSRILQLPSILTADNEPAEMEVKDEQAYSSSNASQGGAVGSGLGGFEEAGTTLRISPHIADGNYLLLNIYLEVSAFVGEPRTLPSGDVIPADKIRRTLQTAVNCPDRHTVVLGGLMGKNQTSTLEQVPGAADLPLIGELFKSTNKRDRDTSLFLFVTPTIMTGKNAFDVLDIESCRRKQKADELIGYTEIYNSQFVGCELQDGATGQYNKKGDKCGSCNNRNTGSNAATGCGSYGTIPRPSIVPGSGSASDRMERVGLLETTRFSGFSRKRLNAESAARRAVLRGSAGRSSSKAAPSDRNAAARAALRRRALRSGTPNVVPVGAR